MHPLFWRSMFDSVEWSMNGVDATPPSLVVTLRMVGVAVGGAVGDVI